MSKPKIVLESLQLLRAIAVILVLLHHSSFRKYISFGFSGIDIFFVLSGFIIYHTSLNNPKLTTKEFLLRRLMRIYPIYWISLCFSLMMLLVWKTIFGTYTGALIELPSANTIIKSIVLFPTMLRIIPVSWALSLEITFYLSFGLLFFTNRKLFLPFISLWVIGSYYNEYITLAGITHDLSDVQASLLNPIIAEFLLGCWIAILFQKYPGKFVISALGLGLTFFMLSCILHAPPTPSQVYTYGLPAALIIWGAANIKTKIPVAFTFIGDASYSIYLFHMTLLTVITKLIIILKIQLYFQNYIGEATIICMTILMSCAIYFYIEKPLLSFGSKKIKHFMVMDRSRQHLKDNLIQ